MSYILDALRRAERERERAPASELRIVTDGYTTRVAARRPLWPLLVLGFAAAFALGALLMIPLLRSAAPQRVIAAPPALAPVAVAEPALDDEDVSEAALLEEAAEPPPPDPQPQPAPQEPVEITEAPPEPATPLQVQQFELTPPAPRVGELKDMPSDFRADFPKLALDVHFYDDDAGRRFVMINSRRYKHGDALQEGPQVREITSDGVILNHRGQDVLLPISR